MGALFYYNRIHYVTFLLTIKVLSVKIMQNVVWLQFDKLTKKIFVYENFLRYKTIIFAPVKSIRFLWTLS